MLLFICDRPDTVPQRIYSPERKIWYISVISALGRQKWKNCHKFDASQDYIVRTCLKRPKPIKHMGVRCVDRIAMQMWGPEFRFLATLYENWTHVTCVISVLGSGDRSRWSFSSAKPISREFCVQWETLSQKYKVESDWGRQVVSWTSIHVYICTNLQLRLRGHG